MRLKKVIIENFRSYKNRTEIDIDDLTVLVGKNDIGKSTIMEALDIFFNDKRASVKLDKSDINADNKKLKMLDIKIAAVFTELPKTIIIDDNYETSLENEYLLNSNGDLEIIKTYKNGSQNPSITIFAQHPLYNEEECLVQKKQNELKKIIKELNINCDKTINAIMRKAIWDYMKSKNNFTLTPMTVQIDFAEKDKKSIWDGIKDLLPHYTLFRADRENNDDDDEIQDPLKTAVSRVLNSPQNIKILNDIASQVQNEVQKTADKTLEYLNKIKPDIAKALHPKIPKPNELKWVDVFKNLSISGENDISLNKRGSGVKRMVLLSFFRAEADRIKESDGIQSIIYAIEEPETAQHKDHQIQLIKTLIELSNNQNAQVLLTTHSSVIVKNLESYNIRIITSEENENIIQLPKERCLPWISLNEVNYIAFNDYSEEFLNELYGYFYEKACKEFYENPPASRNLKQKPFGEKDLDIWFDKNGLNCKKDWIMTDRQGNPYENPISESLQTYIRNYIHHPENRNNSEYSPEELKQAIDEMVTLATILGK